MKHSCRRTDDKSTIVKATTVKTSSLWLICCFVPCFGAILLFSKGQPQANFVEFMSR